MPNDIQDAPIMTLDDIFKDMDELGLLDMSDDVLGIVLSDEEYEKKFGRRTQRNGYIAGEGEVTARQQSCKNFNTYESMIEKAQSDMQIYGYKKTTATESEITKGSVFVFNGLVAIVVALNDSEQRNSGQTVRAHVVYANGTESHLLLSSLSSSSYKADNYLVALTT